MRALTTMVATLLLGAGSAQALPTLTGAPPVVIAHRGASGYLPEESVQAYRLALSMRADYIEGDVYLTADNQGVMLHDGTLNATTNIVAYAATHPDFAALRSPNGTYDVTRFTLAQLNQLSVTCRAANGYCADLQYFDPATSYTVTSYAQFLDLAYDNFLATGDAVGVYPESKQSGLAVAAAILAGLNDPKYGGYFNQPGRAFTQSFDPAQVAYLNANSAIPVAFLGVCPATPAAAAAIAAVADGIGPSGLQLTPACIQNAHDAGLLIHPYTFTNIRGQYQQAYALGVDGVFTNFPDIAQEVRAQVFPVPEPASLALLGLAVGAVAGRRRYSAATASGRSDACASARIA